MTPKLMDPPDDTPKLVGQHWRAKTRILQVTTKKQIIKRGKSHNLM